MEDGIIRPVGYTQDRPSYYSPFPDVLREQLVLHLASVLIFCLSADSDDGTSPEFNEYNAAIFNIRARALNNLVYWITQIAGSVSIGFLLDRKNLARRVRAFLGWAVLFVMVLVVHIWGYFYQRSAGSVSLCECDHTIQCQNIHKDDHPLRCRKNGFSRHSISPTYLVVYILQFAGCHVADYGLLDHGSYVQ